MENSLSKYVAQAGLASRRSATDLIKDGLIKVNGKVIKEPGYKIKSGDTITYLGKPIRAENKIYILLNKPEGYITTVADENNRKTVLDLVRSATSARIYPIGRLDRDTTGLLVLTNDGNLAQQLSHPRNEVEKVYIATVDRLISKEDFAQIKKGVHLKDGFIKVDAAHFILGAKRNKVKLVLHSGKNRIVRRILEFFGYRVMALDRVAYAGLAKKGLKPGRWRLLRADEILQLRKK